MLSKLYNAFNNFELFTSVDRSVGLESERPGFKSIVVYILYDYITVT